jgi:hypothetical protein
MGAAVPLHSIKIAQEFFWCRLRHVALATGLGAGLRREGPGSALSLPV